MTRNEQSVMFMALVALWDKGHHDEVGRILKKSLFLMGVPEDEKKDEKEDIQPHRED